MANTGKVVMIVDNLAGCHRHLPTEFSLWASRNERLKNPVILTYPPGIELGLYSPYVLVASIDRLQGPDIVDFFACTIPDGIRVFVVNSERESDPWEEIK